MVSFNRSSFLFLLCSGFGFLFFFPCPAGAGPDPVRSKKKKTVPRALTWLATHQSPDGAWRGSSFVDQCEPGDACGGSGFSTHDGALTALVTYAMLSALEEHRSTVRSNIKRAGTWLKKHLVPDGPFRFPGEEKAYFANALASLALLHGDRKTSFLTLSSSQRSRIRSGLRKRIRSVSVKRAGASLPECVVPWFLLALEVVHGGPRSIPDEFTKKLDRIVEHSFDVNWVTTDAISAIQGWMHQRFDSPPAQQNRTFESVPNEIRTEPTHDLYATFFWVRFLSRPDNGSPEVMKEVMKHIRSSIRTEGHPAGSWDPAGKWGSEGGRVYSTAIALLIITTAKN